MTFTPTLHGQDFLFESMKQYTLETLPHFFITGPPGSGKTTFIDDLMKFFKIEKKFSIESILWLSSEKDRGIHTIRDKVNDFCKRAACAPNSIRFIIIDDADTLPLISQQALRRPMETFAHLTKFIFASRFASSKLIEPLRSRCLEIELEPISPIDAFEYYTGLYSIKFNSVKEKEELISFCLHFFITIHEIKTIIKLYSSFFKQKITHSNILKELKLLSFSSNVTINTLVDSLGKKEESLVRKSITELYLSGFLLDDILLAIEKKISIFPSIHPEVRFRILNFTILGWISIQQGKEHWLDTMDIVDQVLSSPI